MENSGGTLAINLALICHAFVYIYRDVPVSVNICCCDDRHNIDQNIWHVDNSMYATAYEVTEENDHANKNS